MGSNRVTELMETGSGRFRQDHIASHPTGLEPETFDVRLKKDRQALAAWASSKGHEIVERRPPAEYINPFDGTRSAPLDGSDSRPLDQSQPIGALHPETQNEIVRTATLQNETGRIEDPDILIANDDLGQEPDHRLNPNPNRGVGIIMSRV